MNDERPNSRPVKSTRGKAPVSASIDGGRKTTVVGTVEKLFDRPAKTVGVKANTKRKNSTSTNHLDSQRRGLVEASVIAGVGKDFWIHIFAEVSCYRYPQFLHQLDNKEAEFQAIQHLYKICKTLLTKEECREAVSSRLHRKANRGEIKVYSKKELI